MDNGNFIDIDSDYGYIYRFISMKRLFELFRNKQNVLVKPRLWDDPFENFILKCELKLSNGVTAEHSMRNQFYGQCWTHHNASDAMWRIYSPLKDGVRIRSTVKKLATSLQQARGALSYVECFIGKVKYLNNQRLLEFANNAFQKNTVPYFRMYAQTLLVKRPAFKHEGEIRLLLCLHDHYQENTYSYSLDPHAVIDQIMIDPRHSRNDSNTLKNQIRDKTGFKGHILHSKLYAPPPTLVIPF